MKYLSRFLTILFHPVFMPLIGIFILMNAGLVESSFPWKYQKVIYLLFALFSILLPLAVIPLMYYWNIIKSFEIKERRERFIPLIFTSAALVFLNLVIGRNFHVSLINAYTFSIALTSILVLFANFLLKISIHSTGLGGISGLILLLGINYRVSIFMLFIVIILISGAVLSARLYLKAHSQKEVFLGFLLGLSSTYGFMYFLLK